MLVMEFGLRYHVARIEAVAMILIYYQWYTQSHVEQFLAWYELVFLALTRPTLSFFISKYS